MYEADTLHNSILEAGNLVDSRYPVNFYLNPESRTIEGHTVIGAGIPVPAYHGIWVKIFQAPANAIPDSVVEALLRVESRLEADCEDFQGTEWDGHNFVGVWKDGPSAYYSHEFDIACYWDPDDWFRPIIRDLKEKWEEGMSAEEILDSVKLGNELEGMVIYEDALEWLEQRIKEWKEEKLEEESEEE